jgi:hypothetical protein
MENKEYIRELLDKYLEGNTSVEEEKKLRHFFSQEDIPREFETEALWFNRISAQMESRDKISSLENELSQWVDKQERKEKNIRLRSWIISIAAGFAILVSISLFLKYKQTDTLKDTYEDPRIAYLEAQKVLMYVSETLNKGTEKLEPVSNIEKGSNEMSIFSTFGSGLKNLELMSKYQEEQTKKH